MQDVVAADYNPYGGSDYAGAGAQVAGSIYGRNGASSSASVRFGPASGAAVIGGGGGVVLPAGSSTNYEHISSGVGGGGGGGEVLADYRTHSPASEVGSRRYAESVYGRAAYADYEPYPHLGSVRQLVVPPGSDYAYHQTAQPPGLYRDYPDMPMDSAATTAAPGGAAPPPIYGNRPQTPPSPSERSESPLAAHHALVRGWRAF